MESLASNANASNVSTSNVSTDNFTQWMASQPIRNLASLIVVIYRLGNGDVLIGTVIDAIRARAEPADASICASLIPACSVPSVHAYCTDSLKTLPFNAITGYCGVSDRYTTLMHEAVEYCAWDIVTAIIVAAGTMLLSICTKEHMVTPIAVASDIREMARAVVRGLSAHASTPANAANMSAANMHMSTGANESESSGAANANMSAAALSERVVDNRPHENDPILTFGSYVIDAMCELMPRMDIADYYVAARAGDTDRMVSICSWAGLLPLHMPDIVDNRQKYDPAVRLLMIGHCCLDYRAATLMYCMMRAIDQREGSDFILALISGFAGEFVAACCDSRTFGRLVAYAAGEDAAIALIRAGVGHEDGSKGASLLYRACNQNMRRLARILLAERPPGQMIGAAEARAWISRMDYTDMPAIIPFISSVVAIETVKLGRPGGSPGTAIANCARFVELMGTLPADMPMW